MKFSKNFFDYRSDITEFIETLKKNNPMLEKQQLAGRALLWDKNSTELDTLATPQEVTHRSIK